MMVFLLFALTVLLNALGKAFDGAAKFIEAFNSSGLHFDSMDISIKFATGYRK
jgi:hypothetical protein